MVIQHPVTTEADNRAASRDDAAGDRALGLPTIWFWPNADAGTGEMAESLRHFREHHEATTDTIRFITNVPADEFVALLRRPPCLVGNSSAGIKECSFLGTPVVNIGGANRAGFTASTSCTRRTTRRRFAGAIRAQLAHGAIRRSQIYYKPDASQTIVDLLASAELYTQKRFCDPQCT